MVYLGMLSKAARCSGKKFLNIKCVLFSIQVLFEIFLTRRRRRRRRRSIDVN
jgi:hypothetical protein